MSIKETTYPNKCSRCGFCCISQTCPVAQQLGRYHAPCPLLHFDCEGLAICEIVTQYPQTSEVMGIGKGCCIKARAYKDGVKYDFASLPPETKHFLVQKIRG